MNRDIKYEITEEMLLQSVRELYFETVLTKKEIIALGVVSMSYLYFKLLDILTFNPDPYYFTFIAVFVLMWTMAYIRLRKEALKCLKSLDDREIEITFTDEVIARKGFYTMSRYPWEIVTSIVETKNFIILKDQTLDLVTLPKVYVDDELRKFIKERVQSNRQKAQQDFLHKKKNDRIKLPPPIPPEAMKQDENGKFHNKNGDHAGSP